MVEGSLGVALVDVASGMALGTLGGSSDLDLAVAAAGNTDMVRAKLRVMEMLGVTGGIEDILSTLTTQYHLVRPLTAHSGQACSSTSSWTADAPTWLWPAANYSRSRPAWTCEA